MDVDVSKFSTAFDAYLTQHAQISQLADTNQNAQAYALATGQAAQIHAQMDQAILKLTDAENAAINDEQVSNGKLYDNSRLILISILIGSALIAGIAATWIVVSISRALGSATTGNSSGTITIFYTDGTSSTGTVSLNDWAGGPGNGDIAVATMPYRNSASGSHTLTMYIYATTVPVDPSKTVESVVLPNVSSKVGVTAMHIFALALG